MKPYLKRENPNIVVLIPKGTAFRCAEPTEELSFDRTKTPHAITTSLEEAAKKMKGVTVLHKTNSHGIVTKVIVYIEANETNEIPRYVELNFKHDPYRIAEVETFMRNYGIDLDSDFDRGLNLG